MRRVVGDIRALGWWAPLRAAYEIAKRTGLTGRLLKRRRTPDASARSPFLPGPLPSSGTGWPSGADAVLHEPLEMFGRQIRLGEQPDWHVDADGNRWPVIDWWKIDIRADEARDVKLVWEPARHRHLVVLARGAAEAEEPGPYLSRLESHLRSWIDQNPPEVGVHWLSNLEIAIRATAWLEVLHLVGDRLPRNIREEMAAHLYHSGRHLVAELPYTLSSMRNNHLIGDAVGLAAIGLAFPGDRRAQRWRRLGDRLLRRHVPRHVHDDGSSIEDSLGYRAFVADLLGLRAAMLDPPPEVVAALDRATGHLVRAGVGAGPVPRFGDWDGGTAYVGPPGSPPPESSALLGSHRGAALLPVQDGSDAGGGLGRVSIGPWTVWLKAGAGSSHEHADLLSVSIRHGEHWALGDPGNGSYNRSLRERDYFRMSLAHSVLRVHGEDQRVPHRRFRWRYHPSGLLGEPFDAAGHRVMWGVHDAYGRLVPGLKIVRACLVSEASVIVADWLEGADTTWQLSLPLGPGVTYLHAESSTSLRLPDGTGLGMQLPADRANADPPISPFGAWWANDYDSLRESVRVEVSGRGRGPVAWSVFSGPAPDVSARDRRLVVEGVAIGIAIDAHGRPSPTIVSDRARP
jgi:hypothetical protein